MIALLNVELQKLKNNFIVIYLIVFNLLSVALGSVIFYFNQSAFPDLSNRDLILWGQESLYSSQLFFPILIGVLCSIVWQFEEENNNWMRIKTIPLKEKDIIFTKFLTLSLITGLNQIIFFVLFYCSSLIVSVPIEKMSSFIYWSLMGWLGTTSIIAIQLYFSVVTRNFTFSILISTVGGIFGLLTLFIGNLLFKLFPYSQITIGVSSRSLMNFGLSEIILFIIVNTLYTVIF